MTINKTRLGIVICALAIALVIALVIPFETTVVPAASVRIVDDGNHPAANILVKQEWKDVTIEDEMHVDFLKTDENGAVNFPNRTVRTFLLKRIINTTWRILTQGPHASIGTYGTLTAYGNGNPYVWGWVGYHRNGRKWPNEMQLKRWETPVH